MTTRTLFTALVASALVLGLAGSTSAGTSLELNFNDGYTRSGERRETVTTTRTFPAAPPGKTIVTTSTTVTPTSSTEPPSTEVTLFWQKIRDAFSPEPGVIVDQVEDDITNKAVVHHSGDLTVTPGKVTAVDVVIPSFENTGSGSTGTTEFPIDQLGVSVEIKTSTGTTGPVVLAQGPPPAGAALGYGAAVPEFPLAGPATVDVTLTGQVEPPMPPAAGGVADTRLTVRDLFVRLILEDERSVIVDPPDVFLRVGDPIPTIKAFSHPDTGTGADFGPDGEPGTSDDELEPEPGANWSTTGGNIGTLSNTTGPSTTLTPPDLSPGGKETGQVVATVDGKTAAADVTVVKPPVFTDAANQEVGSLQLYDGVPAAPVPPDARYTFVSADLGIGDVAAILDSLDANGDPIESYELILRPGSSVRSDPIVPVPAGESIPSGPSGGVLFVAAEAGGSLVVRVPGFEPVSVLLTRRVPQHFKAFELDQPEAFIEAVTLVDQFDTYRVRVEEPELLLTPVEKQRAGREPEPILRPEEHLLCHGISISTFPERTAVVSNQFVTRSTLTIGRPKYLCAPAAKSLEGEPGPPPTDLDHYLCYDVRSEDPTFPSETLGLRSQFGEETARIDRARELCNPVEKRRDGRPPEPILRPEQHLVCYRIVTSTAFTPRDAFTLSQFGRELLHLIAPRRLCVPSEKIEAVPPPAG